MHDPEKKRQITWEILSELYLDSPVDYEDIASRLVATEKSLEELEAILFKEVHPALHVHFGPKFFAGIARTIVSPLGIEAETNGIVSHHWALFDQRRNEIGSRVRGFSYGFAFSENPDMSDESLTYLSAVEVAQPIDLPAGMQALEVQKEQYAVFEVI